MKQTIAIVALSVLTLTLSVWLFIEKSNPSAFRVLEQQNKESMDKIEVLKADIAKAVAERNLREDTVYIIHKSIIKNNNFYENKIISVASLDSSEQRKYYRKAVREFWDGVRSGKYNPR